MDPAGFAHQPQAASSVAWGSSCAPLFAGSVPTSSVAAAGFPQRTMLPSNDHSLLLQARLQFKEALRWIPRDESRVCLEAMEKTPQLFEPNRESDPLKFLRRCDFNCWAAAKRMCLYWKERKALFGEERAFLPMTVTGDGALKRDDIMFLEAGVPSILPGRAANGQRIMFFDRRQKPPSRDECDRLRAMSYCFTLAAEEEQAQTKGIIMLVLMTTPRLAPVGSEASVKKGINFFLNGFPIKIKVFALNFPPRSSYNFYARQDFISLLIRWSVSVGLSLENQLEILFEREKGDINKFLREELGMTNDSIPVIAGGTWQFVESQRWCKRRARIERKLRKSSRISKTTVASNSSDLSSERKKAPRQTKPAAETDMPSPGDCEETRLFKKRAANVVHSRRKRERRARELQDMSEEQSRLVRENGQLKAEFARLQGLLQRAQELVMSLDQHPQSLLSTFSSHSNEFHPSLSQPAVQHLQPQDSLVPLQQAENSDIGTRLSPLPFAEEAIGDQQSLEVDDLAEFTEWF